MKTLIFNGSPRKEGDTVSLINKVIENLYGEYKIVNAYDCRIHPCVIADTAGRMRDAVLMMKCRKFMNIYKNEIMF